MLKPYDRKKAVEYAHIWALSRNPDFYDFSKLGGDCTNFVSQCLYAGGGSMIFEADGWFYLSSHDRSPSWASVTSLKDFLLNDKRGLIATRCEEKDVQMGDIVMLRQNEFRFNHSLIISKVGEEICVCGHSNDVLDRNIKEYFALEKIWLHIQGIN